MEGYGEFHDFNIDMIYIGFFEDNLYNGFGILRNYKDNYIYIGEWKNNQRDGVARIFKNKKENWGKFKNNILIIKFEDSNDIVRSIEEKNKHMLDFFIAKNYNDIIRFTKKQRIMDV
jgi:hypothetical protein